MNQTVKLILSAITAFVISSGGAIGVVVASGNVMNKTVWVLSIALGAVSAAKDIRAFLQIPPIEVENPTNKKTP